MKSNKKYICSNCGAIFAKWQGKCSNCNQWNTLTEQVEQKSDSRIKTSKTPGKTTRLSNNLVLKPNIRFPTGSDELDRVLGGGVVNGSVMLIGGAPGVGKSTLLMQVAYTISNSIGKVLYVSGEESLEQIALRAKRLKCISENIFILPQSRLDQFIAEIEQEDFSLVIIDSIQSVYIPEVQGTVGGVSQVRQSASLLSEICKRRNIPLFLIGHITKDGSIAGPKTLEHLVDVVLYFDEDTSSDFRLLKAFKNRFGIVGEVGVFRMDEKGLLDVENPSQLFLSQSINKESGSAITVGIEGKRAFLLELQALVSKTGYSYPQRVIRGLNLTRCLLLLAILEKKVGIPMSNYDCFVNIVGGLKSEDPALDLPFVLAVVSSFRNLRIKDNTLAIGELGLNGALVSPSNMDIRLREIVRTNYNRILVPSDCKVDKITGLEIIPVSDLFSAFDLALEKKDK